jgi:hypothetical protein
MSATRAGDRHLELRQAHDVIGIDGCQRVVVALSGPDTHRVVERHHEDLAVADIAGAGRLADRLDGRFHEGLRAGELDADLLVELEHHGVAAIVLHRVALATVAADA